MFSCWYSCVWNDFYWASDKIQTIETIALPLLWNVWNILKQIYCKSNKAGIFIFRTALVAQTTFRNRKEFLLLYTLFNQKLRFCYCLKGGHSQCDETSRTKWKTSSDSVYSRNILKIEYKEISDQRVTRSDGWRMAGIIFPFQKTIVQFAEMFLMVLSGFFKSSLLLWGWFQNYLRIYLHYWLLLKLLEHPRTFYRKKLTNYEI